ncbi:hypothetical protein C8R44DRAFT_956216, partial [Mycena epipterygia]
SKRIGRGRGLQTRAWNTSIAREVAPGNAAGGRTRGGSMRDCGDNGGGGMRGVGGVALRRRERGNRRDESLDLGVRGGVGVGSGGLRECGDRGVSGVALRRRERESSGESLDLGVRSGGLRECGDRGVGGVVLRSREREPGGESLDLGVRSGGMRECVDGGLRRCWNRRDSGIGNSRGATRRVVVVGRCRLHAFAAEVGRKW